MALADMQAALARLFTEAEARKFLQNGDSPLDASLPVIEWAAWTAVASQLLNTDQALNK